MPALPIFSGIHNDQQPDNENVNQYLTSQANNGQYFKAVLFKFLHTNGSKTAFT